MIMTEHYDIVTTLCSQKSEDLVEEFKRIFYDDVPVPATWTCVFYSCKDTPEYSVRRIYIESCEDFWEKWNRFKKMKGFL